MVVDPCLLVRALEHRYSPPAKLLSLLIHGVVSQRQRTLQDEYDEIVSEHGHLVTGPALAKVCARIEARRAAAEDQLAVLDEALGQHLSREFLLVTSPPLREELRDIAQQVQPRCPEIRPHRVNREIARCTHMALVELEPAPFYIGRDRVSAREYLIHTAIVGECSALITEDEELLLPGDGQHRDPRTGRMVRPYAVEDFFSHEVPFQISLDDIDPPAVFSAFKSGGT